MSESTTPYLPHTRGHKVLESRPTSPIATKGFPPDYSNPHDVKTGESWSSVATTYGIDVWNLIEFNFGAVMLANSFEQKCRQVNWLMREHIGCRHTLDGKNYCFTTKDHPGRIYIPEHLKKKGGGGGGGGTGTIELPENPVKRKDEIARILEEAGLSKTEATLFSKALMGIKLHNVGAVLFELVEVAGVLTVATSTVAAQFGFVFGFLMMLDKVTETGIRNTNRIGFAYALTAWAFDHPRPKFSKNLKKRLKSFGKAGGPLGEHLQAWENAVKAAHDAVFHAHQRFRISGKKVSKHTYMILLQHFGDFMPGRLSLRLCEKMAKGIEDRTERENLLNTVTYKGSGAADACQYPF